MDLVRALTRRLLQTIIVLVGLSLGAFLLGHLAPGDPAYFALVVDGFSEPTAEEIASKRHELGLDQPLPEQYGRWLIGVLGGDLGRSFRTGRSISAEMARRIPITLSVALPAFLITAAVGVALGTVAGSKPESAASSLVDALSGLLIATPGFLIAIAAVTLVSERVSWLPVAGVGSPAHLLLPTLTLSTGSIGVATRLMRSAVIEEKSKRYVAYAYSRGLSSAGALFSHIVPNSLPAVLTYLANGFAGILGGSVIIESVFALPGLGSYVVPAVLNRDLPVVQAFVLFAGFAYIVAQLGVDLMLFLVDPRVRSASQ